MKPDIQRVANAIEVVAHPRGGFQLRIRGEAMRELMPVFEEERSYSNGPAWGALIEYVIQSDPRMSDYRLDDEGLAWCESAEPLFRLRAILLEAAAEPAALRRLIRDGRAAGFGGGDL